MARTVGLKIKKVKGKAQTSPQNPSHSDNEGAKQPENGKE